MRPGMMHAVFVAAVVLFLCSASARAQPGVKKQTGMLPDGATYVIEVPPNWNGILFLYSHGYVVPGTPNPAQDVAITDPATRDFMLFSRFAIAGSSYASTGWALEQALPDQIAVLDIFDQMFGVPKRTIAWGHSLGGMITAGLIQRSATDVWRALGRSCDLEYGAGFRGNGRFLRRTFVSRAGHCSFTPAETITAVQTLLARLETGRRPEVDASKMNAAAATLGPGFNVFPNPQGMIVPVSPAFVDFQPARYLRPFNGEAEESETGSRCGDN